MLTTLPNLLTLSRILAVPVLVGTFYLAGPWAPWIACVLFSAAGITDWLDGHFARRWKQQSEFGRFLDPIADKLVVAAALFMLVAKDRISEISDLPALIILMREILVSGLREHLAGLHVRMPVSRMAKWKTFLQMAAIGVLLVGDAGPSGVPVRIIGEVMLWIAAVLTLVTGYDYLRAGLTHLDGVPAERPAPPSAEPRSLA
jgi:cardiolipin synthase